MKSIILTDERTVQINSLQQDIENILGIERNVLNIVIGKNLSYEEVNNLFEANIFEKIIYFSDEEKESVPPVTLYGYTIPLGIITIKEGLILKLAQRTVYEDLQLQINKLEERVKALEERE